METDSTLGGAPVGGSKYSVSGDNVEEFIANAALLLAEHGWPGFHVTNYKKSQTYEITLPGGQEFALENGLVPLEVVLRFKIRPMTDAEAASESDDNNGVKPVDEYCAMSMNRRLSEGFTTLAGNTASHLSRRDARSRESLAAWQSKQSPWPNVMKKECQCGQNGEPAEGPKDGDEGVNFDFGGFDSGGGSGAQGGDASFRDLFSQFFRGGRDGSEQPEHKPGGGFDSGGGSGAQGGNASFRDLFSQFFRGGRDGSEQPEHEPRSDLEYQIEIDLRDAVQGAVKKLTITRLDGCDTCHGTGAEGSAQTCPTCRGSGIIQQAAGKMKFNVPCTRCGGTGKIRKTCSTCGGEGRLRRTETIDVLIPAGVAGGSRVRLPGEGNAGTMGARGDLYLHINVRAGGSRFDF